MMYDVVIFGGGLVGLCLVLQLCDVFFELDIVVLECCVYLLLEVVYKVGEFIVEIGVYYFVYMLGLCEYLESVYICKFGFCFFFSDGCSDFEDVIELGVCKVLFMFSYQIDCGIFENFLGDEVWWCGIDFCDGVCVIGFMLGKQGDVYQVCVVDDGGGECMFIVCWLFDVFGCVGMIWCKFDFICDNGYYVNVVWFWLDDCFVIDGWCDDVEWQSCCMLCECWCFINYLCGFGYWIWLILLVFGVYLIGIVVDVLMYFIELMNIFECVQVWLVMYQFVLVCEVFCCQDKLFDFVFFCDYFYGCVCMFSVDCWVFIGEVGVFFDLFYLFGIDFIVIINIYIIELICYDCVGELVVLYVWLYECLFGLFYESMLVFYCYQYLLLGNVEVMLIKVIWDYVYYWGVLCQLVFQQRLIDVMLFVELVDEFDVVCVFNECMQVFFG